MNRILRVELVAILAVSMVAGCGDSASTDSSAAPTSASAAAPAVPVEVVASAAKDFLDAVLKGDTQRASARLTPQAMQRIIASGKQFAPPGLETATFRIGEIRTPSRTQALVQCVLTDTSAQGAPRNEEMCCLMRLVENDWRVSGIAYGTGSNQPWTLSDFETGQTMPIPRQPSMSTAAGAQPASGRPSPPRTAQDPADTSIR